MSRSPDARAWPRRALPWLLLLVGLVVVYRPVFQGKLLLGRDMFRLFIPDAALLLECLKSGELPLWNPYLRLGQPFAATLQSQVFYPPRILCVLLAGPYVGLTLEQILHAAIAAAGTWRLCRRLRASRPAAVYAAAAFGLSPLLTDLATQANVVGSAAWTGFLLASALDLTRRPSSTRALALAGFGGLALLAGSPETVLWQSFLAVLLAAPAPRRARSGLAVVGGLAGSLAVSAVAVLPTLEFALTSSRGGAREDLLDWSTSFPQLLALAWPRADLPRGAYWSQDQWFVVTVFLGTLTCAFALASLRRSARVLPLALGGLVLAVLSLGANFAPAAWVLQRPPFVLFRYPAKYLVGAAFCIAALSAPGLDRLSALGRRLRPGLLKAIGVGLGAVLALAVLAPVTALPVFRKGVQQGLPWVGIALGATGVLVFAVPAGPRRASRLRWGLVALGATELLTFHLLQVGFGWDQPRRFTQPSRLAALLPRPFSGRISLPITDRLVGEDAPRPDFIDESRDALVPNRNVEERLPALEGYGAPEPARNDEFLMAGRRPIFDLAGVVYYVRETRKPAPDLEPVPTPPGLPALYRSATAFPRAFVVHRAVVVSDAEALERVRDPAEPTRTTAFLASGTPLDGPACEGSRAELAREGLNALELSLDACGDGYLVLTDAYYPGWTAEVDGASTPVLRADYGVRAVRVGPGHHRVRFHYLPWSFLIGAFLSGASLVAMAAAFARRGAKSG